jgi:hypothetical protein
LIICVTRCCFSCRFRTALLSDQIIAELSIIRTGQPGNQSHGKTPAGAVTRSRQKQHHCPTIKIIRRFHLPATQTPLVSLVRLQPIERKEDAYGQGCFQRQLGSV